MSGVTAADSALNGWGVLAFLAVIAVGVAAAVLAVVVERPAARRRAEDARVEKDIDQAIANVRQAAVAPRLPQAPPDDGGWLADGLDEALRRITEGRS